MRFLSHKKGPMRVLLLLCLLSFSLFLTGTCGAVLVWRSRAAYKDIVNRELPVLALLRDITRQGNATRRAANAFIATAVPAVKAEKRQDFSAAVSLNNRNFEALDLIARGEGARLFNSLRESRQNYVTSALALMDRSSGLDEEGLIAARECLEILYVDYIRNQDALADYAEMQAMKKSNDIIQEGRLLFVFFSIVALWPILISLSFFIYFMLTTGIALIRSRG